MTDDDEAFGPKVHAAEAAPVVRVRQTEREPLAVIQERLRQETARGLSGGRVRRGRQT
jgi:hypothetical protein